MTDISTRAIGYTWLSGVAFGATVTAVASGALTLALVCTVLGATVVVAARSDRRRRIHRHR